MLRLDYCGHLKTAWKRLCSKESLAFGLNCCDDMPHRAADFVVFEQPAVRGGVVVVNVACVRVTGMIACLELVASCSAAVGAAVACFETVEACVAAVGN